MAKSSSNRNDSTASARPWSAKVAITYKDGEGKEKTRWRNIGVAFPHSKGEGFNVVLDAMPIDGKLVILPPKENDDSSGED